MLIKLKIFPLCLLLFFCNSVTGFNKVVLWGHKLHTHTHSYIHNGFFRAFQQMGYPVFWFDNTDDVNRFDFSNSLFITEGQVDEKIPLRDDCTYILHNCWSSKYRTLFEKKQAITLQVYTDDVLTRAECEKIAPCIYYDLKGQCLYMPWATDLLPNEIDRIKDSLPTAEKTDSICWVGSLGEGTFGNIDQLDPFIKAAATQRRRFLRPSYLSVEANIDAVRSSYMAPAIVGKWQQKQGYIPCRIFKNISYGQMGITNSFRVFELFEGKIVYNPDTYQLFFDAQKKKESMSLQEQYDLMDFVRDNHTYVNRIETILDFIGKTRCIF